MLKLSQVSASFFFQIMSYYLIMGLITSSPCLLEGAFSGKIHVQPPHLVHLNGLPPVLYNHSKSIYIRLLQQMLFIKIQTNLQSLRLSFIIFWINVNLFVEAGFWHSQLYMRESSRMESNITAAIRLNEVQTWI